MLTTWLHLHLQVPAAHPALLCRVGCGLSLLAEEMAATGYRSLLAVDFSETCIQVGLWQQNFDHSHLTAASVSCCLLPIHLHVNQRPTPSTGLVTTWKVLVCRQWLLGHISKDAKLSDTRSWT